LIQYPTHPRTFTNVQAAIGFIYRSVGRVSAGIAKNREEGVREERQDRVWTYTPLKRDGDRELADRH